MDWPMEDTTWSAHDLKTFGYEERRTVILRKLDSADAPLEKNELRDKNDWMNWFDEEVPLESPFESGLYILLCSRASPIFGGDDAPVSYVSVTRDIWQRLTKHFYVHRNITKTISRQVTCYSSSYEGERNQADFRICFTARMSANLPGNLALSATCVPSNGSVFCAVYGCNERQIQEIEKRVRLSGEKSKYPFLMVGVFAELEREQLVAAVDKLVDSFALRSEHLEDRSWDVGTEMSNEKTQEYLALCLQSRSLVDQIRAVKRQISKLLGEMDELEEHFLSHKGYPCLPKDGRKRMLKRVGALMRKRLRDIMDEYDDKIDECNMIVGNTTLAMQTVWNQIARHDSDVNTRIAHANTTIALETKRESTQMTSIAVLTMIYLPISSVAAIFSMDMFNWEAQDGESVVSKYFWLFAVLVVGLTAITLFAWRHITYRHEKGTAKCEKKYSAEELENKLA
ncbi:hypothetical protein F4809DRAFT_590041 [Biscogniauxia mediterranea]|nr:hypothetical protein F4809DRAFT_590041 [Biscogniauxia mediterranea]